MRINYLLFSLLIIFMAFCSHVCVLAESLPVLNLNLVPGQVDVKTSRI